MIFYGFFNESKMKTDVALCVLLPCSKNWFCHQWRKG